MTSLAEILNRVSTAAYQASASEAGPTNGNGSGPGDGAPEGAAPEGEADGRGRGRGDRRRRVQGGLGLESHARHDARAGDAARAYAAPVTREGTVIPHRPTPARHSPLDFKGT